ncbi:uncharacterized protein [Dermacentor albipictus]|uniref:uncharacterized protein n=1 Tax=Dermacentor albipictus TaxID=60249 RepID=UPI0038FC7C7B
MRSERSTFPLGVAPPRARSRSRSNTAPEKGDPPCEQQPRPARGDRVSAISRRHENTTVVRHALDITNPDRDNPGRAFLSTQSTARSDSNTDHQWHSAVPLQCCGNCQHQRLCNSCFTACRYCCFAHRFKRKPRTCASSDRLLTRPVSALERWIASNPEAMERRLLSGTSL